MRLFDSIVVFENYPINDEAAAAHGLQVRELQAVETTNYPLLVAVTPGRRLSLELGYDPALFDLATVEALAARLARVLDLLTENPTLPVSRIDIITDDERDPPTHHMEQHRPSRATGDVASVVPGPGSENPGCCGGGVRK